MDFSLHRATRPRWRTRLIILNSPHNPTGGVMSREELQTLADTLAGPRGHEIFILSEEIYSHLIFEGKQTSLARFPGMRERTIILDGFSKAYAMTGWRLGYGVMRTDLAQQISLPMIQFPSTKEAAAVGINGRTYARGA